MLVRSGRPARELLSEAVGRQWAASARIAQLAAGNAVQQGRRSGVSLLQAKGQEATAGQHAAVRSSSASGAQGRSGSPAPGIRFSHLPAHPGVGPGGEQLRSKTGARTTSPLQHQDHPGHLRPSHYVGQTGSAGHVPGRAAEGPMDGEKAADKSSGLAPARILWAYCGLAQSMEFRISALKSWWPGTESNRRRQPFQGCSLPFVSS